MWARVMLLPVLHVPLPVFPFTIIIFIGYLRYVTSKLCCNSFQSTCKNKENKDGEQNIPMVENNQVIDVEQTQPKVENNQVIDVKQTQPKVENNQVIDVKLNQTTNENIPPIDAEQTQHKDIERRT
jgi:hypothetical protein